MSEDVEQMEIFLAHNIPDFVAAFVYTLLAAVVLLVVDWRLALAAIRYPGRHACADDDHDQRQGIFT